MDFLQRITRRDFVRVAVSSGIALILMKYLFIGNKKNSEKPKEGTISFSVSAPSKNKI